LALFACAAALAVSPITLRNFIIGKDFVPLAANYGITFYEGNNRLAKGIYMDPPGLDLDEDFTGAKIAEELAGKPLKPSEVSRFWMRESWKDIQRNPLHYIGLFAQKTAFYWNRSEVPNAESYSLAKKYSPFYSIPLAGFPVAGIFGLLGMALALKAIGSGNATQPPPFAGGRLQDWLFKKALGRRSAGCMPRAAHTGAWVLLLFILCHMVSTAMFFMAARYRISAVPVLLVFASSALIRMPDLFQKKTAGKAALYAAGAISAALLVFFPWETIGDKASRASAQNNLGLFFWANGNAVAARQYYESALRDYPGCWRAWANLANLHLAAGNRAGALAMYLSGLKNGLPADSGAMAIHMNIGTLFLKDGNTEQARWHFSLAFPYVSYSLTMRRLRDELKL
jgi:hypothetical protein